MVFTDEQIEIIEGARHHILSDQVDEQIYQISGEAGTGKSTIIKEIIKRIGIPLEKIAVMTYIGQASILLRAKGLFNSKTIHSWCYEMIEVPLTDDFGNKIMDPIYDKPMTKIIFKPREELNVEYIIVDEAYTVPLSMKKTITGFGKKIIAVGDCHQLPPVGDEPAFLVNGEIHYLTTPFRQSSGSNIINLAKALYREETVSPGLYGNVMIIEERDLTPDMIKYANIIACSKNSTRDRYNNYIRNNILHIDSTMPVSGEKVICRQNQWDIEANDVPLVNGLIGTVINNVGPLDIDRNKRIFKMDFKPDMFNGIFWDLKCDYDYFKADYKMKNQIKNSPFHTASKFEFAYANTTHLLQGSQYLSGIYIKEYFRRDLQKNLDYTAITRFSDMVIMVLPERRYY